MKKYMYKERIGADGKSIIQCYVATDLEGNIAKVVVKPYDTFFGEVRDNAILLFFNNGKSGMFCSMADYFEEVVENKKEETV